LYEVHTIITAFISNATTESDTNVLLLLTDQDIKTKYREDDVPEGLKYKDVIALRDKKLIELFKIAFEGNNPSKLSDKDIDS